MKSVLSAAAPPDTVRLILAMSFDPDEVVVDVPVRRPQVTLNVRSTLAGWGIGSAKVVVSLEACPSDTPRQVSLDASRGELGQSSVMVSRSRSQTVRCRSAGTGPATITAESAGLGSASHPITLRPPIAFFLPAIIAAAIGAVVKHVFADDPWTKGNVIRVLAGLLVGVVVAVAWSLGVNLLPVSVPLDCNEVTVGLVGFIGAVGSKAVLDKFSGNG